MAFVKKRERMSNQSISGVGLSKREIKKNYKYLVRSLLTEAEKEFMYRCAKKYQRSRHIEIFCQELVQIINTPGKLRLMPYIRTILSEFDKHDFDKFVARLDYKLEGRTDFTIRSKPDTYSHAPSVRSSIPNGRSDLRVVVIPHRDENLGFSIRGGSEHGLGIFVSEVDDGSTAAASGLEVGDQILEANNISLENAACSSAVRVLTVTDRLKLVVKRTGKLPEWKFAREKVLWYDVHEGDIIAAAPTDPDTYHISGLDRQHIREKRVAVKTVNNTDFIGLNIRGGSEYGLGIFVSRVDPGGLAEKNGVCTGDQILDVNGTDFSKISHSAAADYLRTNPNLVLTLREVGRYPAYKELFAEYTWSDRAHRNSGRVAMFDSPISSRHSTLHIRTTPQYASRLPMARSLDNIPSTIYLPSESRSGDLIYHEENLYEFRSDRHDTTDLRLKDDDYDDTHFVRLNGNDMNDTDSGKIKRHQEQRVFPSTSKVIYENDLRQHYETAEIVRPEIQPAVYISDNYSQREATHIRTNPIYANTNSRGHYVSLQEINESTQDRPLNLEEYVIPKSNLPVHQQNGVDTVDTVIVTEVQEEPVYSKVNKKKLEKTGAVTDGSMTPEEEEVLNDFQEQLKMLEDRKSHLGNRAITQIDHSKKDSDGKKGTWSRLKSKLKGGITNTDQSHPALQTQASIDPNKMAILKENAQEKLPEKESTEVISLVESYHETKDLDSLVKSLLKILDKPDKMLLLRDVRGVIYPYHIARFDNMVNFYEIERYEDLSTKLHLPLRHRESMKDRPKKQLMTTVLDKPSDYDENGHFHIKTVDQYERDKRTEAKVLQTMKTHSSFDSPQPVAAKPVAAKPVAVKPVAVKPVSATPVSATPVAAKPIHLKETSAITSEHKPTTPEPIHWVKLNHVADSGHKRTIRQIFNNKDGIPHLNSTVVFVPKLKKTLGLRLRGGLIGQVFLPVRIDEVLVDSAAADEEKLQPGVTLISVDSQSLGGYTVEDTEELLEKAFHSKATTMIKLEINTDKRMA
ncbi:PDZ domain-containing protein 7-like isoform X2 [Haliotis rufescens]|uniref:PDZ domain-containing protein 7-like isoform X2 n=1 Tax=Haliotis rufescens TaxID=6454 RepID=UPI00201EEEC8|nr:PDZ domain-containing protein 7-like isoform X2 [Haliotis rufescens]